MIRRLVHTVVVPKPGLKMQLRIELPSNIKRIVGIHPMINSRGYNGHTNQPEPRMPFEGSLWLRCSDKRDVFYAENVKESLRDTSTIGRYPSLGFLNTNRAWITGVRPEVFNIDVPVKQTIIEGYFEDTSNKFMRGYTLEIYLYTEL